MRKRLGVYEAKQFDELIELINREKGNKLNVRRLMRDMQTFVLHSALPEHLSEEQQAWAGFANETQMTPLESARALEKLLKAPNPLARGVCPEGLKPSLNAKLARRLEQRRRHGMSVTLTSLARDNWKDLSIAERDEVFKAIEELQTYYELQVSRGRPTKDKLDTALWRIVEIWAEQTGCQDAIDEAPYEVPHKENSRFIQFASIAMQPCGDVSETSLLACSRRWGRMKQLAEERAHK